MKWLARDLIVGPYLALATSETEFRKALRHCRIPLAEMPEWVPAGKSGCAHYLTNPDGDLVCVVAIRIRENVTPIQVAGLLVHEAVHVWQRFRADINEHEPSAEFEAYAIQSIAQRLMHAYSESL